MIDAHKISLDLADRLNPDDGTELEFIKQARMIEEAIEDAYKAGYKQAQEDS